MKKALVIILVLSVAVALLPRAASADAKFGFKGGISLAKYRVTPAPAAISLENLTWPTGGVFLRLGYGPLSIQPEGLYVRMGVKFAALGGGEISDRFEYVQIPVLVRLTFLYAGSVRPVIFAGPYGAILLGAKETFTPTEGEATVEDVKTFLNKADWGAVFGAGIDFETATAVVSIEARYSFGIYNINQDLLDTTSTLKNRAVMVYLGIGF